MSVYQHFREHEHPFIDRVLSWIDQVENMYTVYVSDFLDPREQQIIAMLIGSANDAIHYDFFGGVSVAERKRAVIAPKFVPIEKTTLVSLLYKRHLQINSSRLRIEMCSVPLLL